MGLTESWPTVCMSSAIKRKLSMLSVERYEYSYCVLVVDALPLFLIFTPTGQMPEMQYPHLHFMLVGNLINLPFSFR